MILDKNVQIRINNGKIAEYYSNKGYKIPVKYSDKLETNIYDYKSSIYIDPTDLPPNSEKKINVECDLCHIQKQITYASYYKSIKNNNIYVCTHCCYYKLEKTMLEKYGVKHNSLLPQSIEKRKNTMMEKYGVEYPLQNDKIKQKQIETTLNKFGVKNASMTTEIKNKIIDTNNKKYGANSITCLPETKARVKRTCLNHFGVDNPLKCSEILQKQQQTIYNKYGVTNVSLSKNIQQKKIDTCLNNYGVKYPSQNPEILKKQHLTMEERYGFEYALQVPEFINKANRTKYNNSTITSSKQQRYLFELLSSNFDAVFNYPLEKYNIDIFFPNDNIAFEYDGSGHDLNVKLGYETINEFHYKEMIREKIIQSHNIKIIRLLSIDDYLPLDDKILEIFQFAKQYLINEPNHHWINFDVNNNCYYNYYNPKPNGAFYNFGNLRKITLRENL